MTRSMGSENVRERGRKLLMVSMTTKRTLLSTEKQERKIILNQVFTHNRRAELSQVMNR